MRVKDINGNYINNAIGYCHCEMHPGALNHDIAYRHKCVAKRCKHLEKYSENAFRRQQYKNKRRRK